MKAAILEAYSEPLRVGEVRDPEPAPGEACVRVRATGICGTDLKFASGALRQASPPVDPDLPRIPGHEVAGELVEAVDGLGAGDRVACNIYEACGECDTCVAGRTTLCANRVRLGLERDGGFAELVAVPRDNLLPFSVGVPFSDAAVTMDAVAVPWRALHVRGELQAGHTLAIAGAGGLGLHAIQIARLAGCGVAVLDPVESHRTLALELGAEVAVRPEDAGEIVAWSNGGVDVALETSGRRGGFAAAEGCLRRGGVIVSCGYQPGTEYGLDSARLALHEIEVKGSVGTDIASSRSALAAVEQGAVKPVIADRMPLEDVNAALARLAAGEVEGRLVIEV